MDYLLRPPSTLRSPRPGLAIAILVIYSVLLFFFAFTYARLLYTVTVNPGYVPRSNQWYALQENKRKAGPAAGAFTEPAVTAAPGLQDFFGRDTFVCQSDGRPIWCSTCLNWKTDRAHHCREIGRCVRKMDHFCPW